MHKVQGTRDKEEGTRHKAQDFLRRKRFGIENKQNSGVKKAAGKIMLGIDLKKEN